MGRGKRLSEYERGIIDGMEVSGHRHTDIANHLGRSQNVVSNYLRDRDRYLRKYKTGRPSKTSHREKRQLVKDVVQKGMSIMEAKRVNQLTACKTSLWNVLNNTENVKFLKRLKAPLLTDEHKKSRMAWASKHMTYGVKWRQVIFTDEKRFNLDGPDGFKYYWHDLRNEPKFFSTRVAGGGSVQVWAGVGYQGKTELVFINGRNNSLRYEETIKTYLKPFARRIAHRPWILQQDNCSFHVSEDMKTYFDRQNIRVLNWPARSPDLNIIENVWGEMARLVYGGGRQFSTVDELKTHLIDVWENLSQQYIQNLFDSMDKRLFNLIKLSGSKINY